MRCPPQMYRVADVRADVVELGTIFCVHGAPEIVNMGLVSTWHSDRGSGEAWQPVSKGVIPKCQCVNWHNCSSVHNSVSRLV